MRQLGAVALRAFAYTGRHAGMGGAPRISAGPGRLSLWDCHSIASLFTYRETESLYPIGPDISRGLAFAEVQLLEPAPALVGLIVTARAWTLVEILSAARA